MKLHDIKRVGAVSRIENSCVKQAVIVTIIVVLVKCEEWHKVVRTVVSLTETKHCN